METKNKKSSLGSVEIHPLEAIRLKVAEIKKRAKSKGQKIVWPR